MSKDLKLANGQRLSPVGEDLQLQMAEFGLDFNALVGEIGSIEAQQAAHEAELVGLDADLDVLIEAEITGPKRDEISLDYEVVELA